MILSVLWWCHVALIDLFHLTSEMKQINEVKNMTTENKNVIKASTTLLSTEKQHQLVTKLLVKKTRSETSLLIKGLMGAGR